MTTDNAREAMAVWLDASLVPRLLARDGEAGFLAGYVAGVAAERERCWKALRDVATNYTDSSEARNALNDVQFAICDA